MKTTGIEWTDSTWNPWHGCERVSPACAHCYADALSKRWGRGDLWDTGKHLMMSETQWRKPRAWNREAEAHGVPNFVFCASMADVFEDHRDLDASRVRLWGLIEETPWLVWLLLTKRPENIEWMLPWAEAPANVWLGTSIENSRWTHRVERLIEVPAPVHFLSCEPLLGSLFQSGRNKTPLDLTDLEWVIGGGESGPGFRTTDPAWARELRDECLSADVPFFWKQNGGRWPKATGKELDGREWCERPIPALPSLAVPALF